MLGELPAGLLIWMMIYFSLPQSYWPSFEKSLSTVKWRRIQSDFFPEAKIPGGHPLAAEP